MAESIAAEYDFEATHDAPTGHEHSGHLLIATDLRYESYSDL
jgi:hypothetical protein